MHTYSDSMRSDEPTPVSRYKPLDNTEKTLLQELFDALWFENLFGFQTVCSFEKSNLVQVLLKEDKVLIIPVRCSQAPHRPIRLSGQALQLRVTKSSRNLMTLAECIRQMTTADWWPKDVGTEVLKKYAKLSVQQLQFFLDQELELLKEFTPSKKTVSLQQWEKLSCLRDRPFHPFSHAKCGWDLEDEQHYGCFSQTPIALYWLAVPKSLLLNSADITVGTQHFEVSNTHIPWQQLLDEKDFQQLHHAIQSEQFGEDYQIVPVHPWQWHWLNLSQQKSSRPWLQHCVLLKKENRPLQLGELAGTASLRSLAIIRAPQLHLKLSCSIGALGATRTQPPRYLQNGTFAQQTLQGLKRKDAWLENRLWLCEENIWCALLADTIKPNTKQQHNVESLIHHLGDEVGEISYLLRRYPEALMQPNYSLVPLSALAVLSSRNHAPAWQWLIHCLYPAEENNSTEQIGDADRAQQLFEAIITLLIEFGYRCLKNGVMPELHGQNVLLVIGPITEKKNSTSISCEIKGLLLRDHDTLRICPALMKSAGNSIPPYIINHSTPNTLILENAEELFAYFQTLTIEVCCQAMAITLAEGMAISEKKLWEKINTALIEHLDLLKGSLELDRKVAASLLSRSWPFKSVLSPLLHQQNPSTGMPSAMVSTTNPLLAARE